MPREVALHFRCDTLRSK